MMSILASFSSEWPYHHLKSALLVFFNPMTSNIYGGGAYWSHDLSSWEARIDGQCICRYAVRYSTLYIHIGILSADDDLLVSFDDLSLMLQTWKEHIAI